MPMVRSISPSEVWTSLQQGESYLIDIRPQDQFCHGHPLGALCVPLSQQGFAERVVTATGSQRPVVLLTSPGPAAELAELQLRDAGWLCRGAVDSDPATWLAAGAQWSTIAELPITALDNAGYGSDLAVLDVREPLEWETGHVPGAFLVSLGTLREELDRIPKDADITVICEAGLRSATAASILESCGFVNVSHLPEGTSGYRRSGRPLEYVETEQESHK